MSDWLPKSGPLDATVWIRTGPAKDSRESCVGKLSRQALLQGYPGTDTVWKR